MVNIGERIKELRLRKKLTQSGLAEKVNMSYIQIGRYETQKSVPSSEVLQKLAAALETTSDFLMNGDADEVVSAQLTDKELLQQFKRIVTLPEDKKAVVKELIDAFLFKNDIQQKLAS